MTGSADDAEAVFLGEGRGEADLVLFDEAGEVGLDDDFVEELINFIGVPFDDHFDRSVGEVFDFTDEIEAGGEFFDGVSKTDSLDATGKGDEAGFHGCLRELVKVRVFS